MIAFLTIPRALCLAAVGALVLLEPAAAQNYPNRNISMVVAFAAGGVADVVARLVSHDLSERFGHSIVVENRGGAAGNIAAKLVAKAEPDGYTLLASTSSLAVSESTGQAKGYSVEELRPVAIVAFSPYVIAVPPGNPAKTLKEFIANGKEKSFTFGSPGAGSGPHIGAEYFFREVAKVKAVHVPFTGGGPALTALLGAHIDSLVITFPTVEAAVNSHQLRGLGLASEKRSSSMPEVPTFAEAGYPNIDLGSWIGFFAPVKTPEPVIAKLNAEINKVMEKPETKARFRTLGFDVMIKPVPATEAFFKSEVKSWGKMVRAVGAAVN